MTLHGQDTCDHRIGLLNIPYDQAEFVRVNDIEWAWAARDCFSPFIFCPDCGKNIGDYTETLNKRVNQAAN